VFRRGVDFPQARSGGSGRGVDFPQARSGGSGRGVDFPQARSGGSGRGGEVCQTRAGGFGTACLVAGGRFEPSRWALGGAGQWPIRVSRRCPGVSSGPCGGWRGDVLLFGSRLGPAQEGRFVLDTVFVVTDGAPYGRRTGPRQLADRVPLSFVEATLRPPAFEGGPAAGEQASSAAPRRMTGTTRTKRGGVDRAGASQMWSTVSTGARRRRLWSMGCSASRQPASRLTP
jgi:hypothetical protein